MQSELFYPDELFREGFRMSILPETTTEELVQEYIEQYGKPPVTLYQLIEGVLA